MKLFTNKRLILLQGFHFFNDTRISFLYSIYWFSIVINFKCFINTSMVTPRFNISLNHFSHTLSSRTFWWKLPSASWHHTLHNQSPPMKPILTWWGVYLTKRFHPVHQQEELVGTMLLRSSRTNGSSLCKCQGLHLKWKNLD